MDLGRTRGKIKRQRRHSKKEKVEKVFWCGNSEELKKKGNVKMSQHKFSKKKVFSAEKKNRKEYFALSKKKNKKCKQMRNTFFQKKK